MSYPVVSRDRYLDLRDESRTHHTQEIDTSLYDAGAPAFGGATAVEDFPEEPAWPRRGFGGPFGAVTALLISVSFVALMVLGQSLPDQIRSITGSSMVAGNTRSVPVWWSVVLLSLTAVWCWTAAGRARRSRRWLRFLLWGLLSLVILAASLVSLIDLRSQITTAGAFDRWGLPHYVVAHPVDAVAALCLIVPAVILLFGCTELQRSLMFFGVVLYVVGSVVVAGGGWHVSGRADLQQLAQLAFEWGGMGLIMLVAGLERVRPRIRRRG